MKSVIFCKNIHLYIYIYIYANKYLLFLYKPQRLAYVCMRCGHSFIDYEKLGKNRNILEKNFLFLFHASNNIIENESNFCCAL